MSDEKHAALHALDVLQFRSLEGKRDYVRSLEERGDEQALSLLVECLCDESGYLRDLAEHALVRLGPRTVTVLLPHLTQGLWFTRVSVARILGRLGIREAIEGLLELAQDPNGEAAVAAQEGLARVALGGHSVPVARALHARERELQEGVIARAEELESGLGERLRRLLGDRELMTAREEEVLREDAAAAVAHENLEWEVLTGETEENAPPARAEASPRDEGA